MDKNISVSVVIPAYNASKTIIKCIESALNQTKPVTEIIVVNDGSIDDTIDLLNDYKSTNQIEKLIIISQLNGGPAKARNRGIATAKGNWIALLDSDDIWLPEKNEKQIQVLEKHIDCSIIGSAFYKTGVDNSTNKISKISFFKMLFKNQLNTSTVLVKKDVVLKYLFDENKSQIGTEDFKLWLQIIYSHTGYLLDVGMAVYADNQNVFRSDTLSSNLYKMEKGQLLVFKFLYKQKMVNLGLYILINIYSLIKYIRRLIISIL